MRRSTAVEILQATLDLYFPDSGYDTLILAKSMLETVETNVGMIPPSTTIYNTDEENMPTWEPENDEK